MDTYHFFLFYYLLGCICTIVILSDGLKDSLSRVQLYIITPLSGFVAPLAFFGIVTWLIGNLAHSEYWNERV